MSELPYIDKLDNYFFKMLFVYRRVSNGWCIDISKI